MEAHPVEQHYTTICSIINRFYWKTMKLDHYGGNTYYPNCALGIPTTNFVFRQKALLRKIVQILPNFANKFEFLFAIYFWNPYEQGGFNRLNILLS